jgi:hypothetical protein
MTNTELRSSPESLYHYLLMNIDRLSFDTINDLLDEHQCLMLATWLKDKFQDTRTPHELASLIREVFSTHSPEVNNELS